MGQNSGQRHGLNTTGDNLFISRPIPSSELLQSHLTTGPTDRFAVLEPQKPLVSVSYHQNLWIDGF